METDPSSISAFFEDQLKKVGMILNDYTRNLILSFRLLPYVNCLNSPDVRLPPVRESVLPHLPFGVYFQSGVLARSLHI